MLSEQNNDLADTMEGIMNNDPACAAFKALVEELRYTVKAFVSKDKPDSEFDSIDTLVNAVVFAGGDLKDNLIVSERTISAFLARELDDVDRSDLPEEDTGVTDWREVFYAKVGDELTA